MELQEDSCVCVRLVPLQQNMDGNFGGNFIYGENVEGKVERYVVDMTQVDRYL